MKFKFCADGDCPLWALAALHALGSLPAPIFRTLLHHVVEKQPDDGIMEILKDTSLSSRDECARAASVLRWALKQAHRCGCSSVQFARDLLVMGVPRAHTAALAEIVETGREAYETQQKENGFMINKVSHVSVSPGPEGSIDAIKLTLHADEVFTGVKKTSDLLIDKNQVKALLAELKKAQKKMEEIETE